MVKEKSLSLAWQKEKIGGKKLDTKNNVEQFKDKATDANRIVIAAKCNDLIHKIQLLSDLKHKF